MAYKSVSTNAKTYYSGLGYALGLQSRRVNFKSKKAQDVFDKGLMAGYWRVQKNPHKYPEIKGRRIIT